MKHYIVSLEVVSARGSQLYRVQADSEEEARALVDGGNGQFLCEELEVTETGATTCLGEDRNTNMLGKDRF